MSNFLSIWWSGEMLHLCIWGCQFVYQFSETVGRRQGAESVSCGAGRGGGLQMAAAWSTLRSEMVAGLADSRIWNGCWMTSFRIWNGCCMTDSRTWNGCCMADSWTWNGCCIADSQIWGHLVSRHYPFQQIKNQLSLLSPGGREEGCEQA